MMVAADPPAQPLRTPLDPWDSRFGFFWYNDAEIFSDSQADLDRKAAVFARVGINHVITFSCTHFRWSFRRSWDLLTEVLARVVRACHASGIRVTEHHSSHLTFNPLDEAGELLLDRVLAVRGSARASWPHLRADCDADPLVGGAPLSSFRQIDGRTGGWARTSYQGWGMCFNNPDYRRAYLAYLETLYATGIDGIMTDDVQYFGEGHACACAHCRRLYGERTGRDLPAPGADWTAWYGDYDDPTFRAWLSFKLWSTLDFHGAVKAHYEGLGIRPLRPNYCSHVLNRNWTSYALETLPDLDWIFQENCYSSIVRYSWPCWATEAPHRYAVARRRGIPPMSMFYPDRVDTLRFTWALAMSWAHVFLCTPEGASIGEQEGELRSFEKRHARLLFRTRKIARLGFYDSRRNRELYGGAESRSLPAMKSWMQACCHAGIPFDLFQTEDVEDPRFTDRYAAIVLNEVAMLSDGEIAGFRAFVERGGLCVWTGAAGTRDEHGAPREPTRLSGLWGASLPVADRGTAASREPPLERVGIGSGALLLLPGDWGLGPFRGDLMADRWQAEPVRKPFPALTSDEVAARERIAALLAGLLPGGPDLTVQGFPAGVLATVYLTEDQASLVVHLVNAAGTLDVPPGEPVGHADRIPFPRHPTGTARIEVRLPDDLSSARVRAARAIRAPSPDDPVSLEYRLCGGRVEVAFPRELLDCCCLVEIELDRSALP
jgi:hypothetical protein